MKYLTVGINDITGVRNIEDTEAMNIKPKGGLWLTKYENEYYNEWVDYLLEHPVAFVYKSRGNSIWEQPCSLVTLKDDSNIYQLEDQMSLDYLKYRYPLDYNKFSYQALSRSYDGIYVDMYKLLNEVDSETRQRIYKFGVNSLILFNQDCIDYYQSGVINIEPFDYEYDFCEAPIYNIKCDDVKKRILRK